ncbi:hypothetical protein SAMN04487949_0758 [Halogranum gelatinilyticum]|uniref:Uncharacterized protein n=1 Tax=Halogranum gelatinilyticum TaxID=660521 RepID=A0A1G9QA42_9EURY|nr:hypothetical protein [Halogranum gelatinilyticum]SDM07829.1 hypothetical protein SAMN04487949_0758 [Halogranum gelatinilyticum]
MDVLHISTTNAEETRANRRVDVTEMDAKAVTDYVRSELSGASVRLERRANRTYLVADGLQ